MRRLATIVFLCILCSAVVYAQNRVTDEYTSWQEKFTSTKAFLILQQDKYAPGDTVFFSAFFLTEDGRYVAGYQILKIAIIDFKGQTVQRQLVSVYNGIGGNQLVLPRSIPEGNYMIVAYNEYMKSFRESFYFRKEIRVVTRNSIRTDVSSMAPIVAAEGGHLVQEIPNRVMIVVPDSVTRTVTISNAQGREIAVENLDEFGTASVLFTPVKGDQYYVTANGKRTAMQAVEEDGCSLQLAVSSGDRPLTASVALPARSKWRNSEMTAALTIDGALYYTAAFNPGSREAMTVQFPTKDLPGGLALISIIAADGSMLAARHFYRPSAPPLQYSIHVSKSNIVANENITSEISITDADGNPVEGLFTVTAVNESLFDHSRKTFPTDINIVSELATFYSGTTATGWPAAVDRYLATQPGSISWPAIMAESEPLLKAPPKFVNISGVAYFADTNLPIPDSSVFSGYMTKNRFSFEVNSGKNGQLDLGFVTLDGRDEMYYFVESGGKELERVKIRWTHDSLSFRASPWKLTAQPDKYATFITNKNAIDRSFNFFGTTKAASASANFDSSLEGDLRNTGTTINVREYRVFTDMPDLMLEIIPRLYYRKTGRREVLRVVFSDAYAQPTSSPLYIIDGILTRSTSVFLSLSPADIITVKVIHDPAELSRFQAIGKHGIVIVKTEKGNGAKNAARYTTHIDGTNEIIPFRPPGDRAPGTRRKPDFRSTIYWNPDVRTDKNGKATVSFFATDDVGKVKILVRGLAAGQYFEGEKIIEVSAVK